MKKKFSAFLVFILFLTFLSTPSINSFSEEIDNSSLEKTIYLTFDDGPAGKVTNDILDTLKKNDVKATFFVIGNQIKGQEDILKRMISEGHALGLHSYSHDRGRLYCSNEGFIGEMLKTQEIIFNATNTKCNILRFPFGCNNNSYKLKKSLVDEIHNNNLKIYDWNVDSGDGENHTASPSTFIRKSKSKEKNVVLLMHCGYINKNSSLALQSIIDYYKENGYEFKAITEDTPEVFHYLNKK